VCLPFFVESTERGNFFTVTLLRKFFNLVSLGYGVDKRRRNKFCFCAVLGDFLFLFV
jgi:hypothetical protein